MVGDLEATPMVEINWNPYRDGSEKPITGEATLSIKEF
jgi:hypothetical protein